MKYVMLQVCYVTRYHTLGRTLSYKMCYFSQVTLDLLTSKPELEQKLLSGLVNKLGDPDRKVAANVTHLLSLLGEIHAH